MIQEFEDQNLNNNYYYNLLSHMVFFLYLSLNYYSNFWITLIIIINICLDIISITKIKIINRINIQIYVITCTDYPPISIPATGSILIIEIINLPVPEIIAINYYLFSDIFF